MVKLKVVIDIEGDGIHNPKNIWVIVCKDLGTGKIDIFREVTSNDEEKQRFLDYAKAVKLWIGHNILGYDLPTLRNLLGLAFDHDACADTLIASRLANYSRPGGHSLEQYGIELGCPKGANHQVNFFKGWSQALEDYCVQDVEISHRVFDKLRPIFESPQWRDAILLESAFQLECNSLRTNGFCFNTEKAGKILLDIQRQLEKLDKEILTAFPPKEVLVREFTPKATKFGTVSRTSVPRSLWSEIHNYEVGNTYPLYKTVPFNPASHKQLIEVLNEAGWVPTDKSQAHVEAEREYNRLKYKPSCQSKEDLEVRLKHFKVYGWKVNEENLSTLPKSAPEPSRLLAQRILLESRRRSLREWLDLVQDDGRIHGDFIGIGAWTHRMAHQRPNTANIPKEFNIGGTKKLYGRELRELWCAPKKKLLVGVDAEGIQLRIFAHYINDEEFTNALVRGKKSDKSDPHSLNKGILGDLCKTRDAAKRFVYALLLGGGMSKLAFILESSEGDTKRALDRLLLRYTGFRYLREEVFPEDAKKGFFIGLDGRKVPIPGDTIGNRKHLCMSGYLQNGEAIIVKRAALIAGQQIRLDPLLASWKYVDIVHDELQSEVDNKMSVALKVAEIKANAIKAAGEYYKLKCPMAGSYWNDDRKDYSIGTNWYQTH